MSLRFVLRALSLLLVFPTASFAQSQNFLSFGLQFPWRSISHEGNYAQVSAFDSYQDGSRSWDGSIGHYFEVGRFFGQDRGGLGYRCGAKVRGDFDFRSDHDVAYEVNANGVATHESELDLSIFSLMPMAECQADVDTRWSLFLDVGGGIAAHVNGIKYTKPSNPDATVTVPDFFSGYSNGTTTSVNVDWEPSFAIGTGVSRSLSDSSSLRLGGQYRYMGTNQIYDKNINETSFSLGIRVGF